MSQVLNSSEVSQELVAFPGWELGEDGQLHAEFTFKNFSQALLFVNAVGHLANALDHHPDILIHSYKQVRLSMISHDVGGITRRDFRLIKAISELPQYK